MPCAGLHCPGCSSGQSLGILGGVVLAAVVADETVQWVAGHIWEIGGTLAVCFALAVAVSMWMERWADVRGARFAARHGILSRADVILPEAPMPAVTNSLFVTAALDSQRPALGFRDVHIHLDGVPPAEQAEVIRRALGG
jgi:hypothetical protein